MYETEGCGEHADGDGARAAERNDDRQDPVSHRAPEEPSRREDHDADEDDGGIEDQRRRPDAEIADVIPRDTIAGRRGFGIHGLGEGETDDGELAASDEQAQPGPR